MYANGFRSISLPSPGFFSPFPHGTGSLSVSKEYLALDDGPPIFNQDFTCPGLLVRVLSSLSVLRIRGYHPLSPTFPSCSTHTHNKSHQALPRSLAATRRISFDFFSFGYLDVSVPRVRFLNLWIQLRIITVVIGFPHSDISGSTHVSNSPELFAGFHVLHRLLLPRHPPFALLFLTI